MVRGTSSQVAQRPCWPAPRRRFSHGCAVVAAIGRPAVTRQADAAHEFAGGCVRRALPGGSGDHIIAHTDGDVLFAHLFRAAAHPIGPALGVPFSVYLRSERRIASICSSSLPNLTDLPMVQVKVRQTVAH